MSTETTPAPRSRVEGLLEEGRAIIRYGAGPSQVDEMYALIRSLCEALGEAQADAETVAMVLRDVCADMTVGERYTETGQAVVDAMPSVHRILDAARGRHGEDCYVTNVEGDPGNQCHCGKELLLAYVDETKAEALTSLGLVKGRDAQGSEIWE